VPLVELLWWQECPSTDRALAELREVLEDVGLGGVDIQLREIRTDVDAADAEFRGSPTILIDGVDPLAAQDDDPIGLSCRVYRRRDGSISPTPDPDDLRDALREVNR
jgi:hypothetical protein